MQFKFRPPNGVLVKREELPRQGFDSIKLVKDTSAIFAASTATSTGPVLVGAVTGNAQAVVFSPSDRLRLNISVLHYFVNPSLANPAANSGGNTSGWKIMAATRSEKLSAADGFTGLPGGPGQVSGDTIVELNQAFPSSGLQLLHSGVSGQPISGGYEMDTAAPILLVKFTLNNADWTQAEYAAAGIFKSTICRLQVTWEPNCPIDKDELKDLYTRCIVSVSSPVSVTGV